MVFVLSVYFIEGDRGSNRKRERERLTCVLFLVLNISENMTGSG